MIPERFLSRLFVLGTRGSTLAITQANIVRDALLTRFPDVRIEIRVIRTQGDEPSHSRRGGDHPNPILPSGEGIFVRSIERALLAGRIDFAVHSFKDMPSVAPSEFALGAFPVRDDPRDALVTRSGQTLTLLPKGAMIGTGSPRRRALLLDARPDLVVEPVRGNVDTRLRSVSGSNLEGVILAAAGLRRLGRESEITELLDPRVFVPAIGQGTLAVEARSDDETTLELVRSIDDAKSRACALAERAVAVKVQAGCSTPVAAFARLQGQRIEINAFILAADGRTLVRAELSGPSDQPEKIGAQLGDVLLAGYLVPN